MSDNHCKDCCCARSWAALGITEYDGKSIPEHISALRSELDALNAKLTELMEAGVKDGFEIEGLKRDNARLRGVFLWLLGLRGDFPARPEGAGAYWWRKELRRRWKEAGGAE
jgi:hypothetical protein